ncbi:MAG: hypothetical protein HYV09_39140 [Deltaproteobacteria bacterium]|nr:hypothetical protein [Deltaproteobacteria bacterium]
MTKQRKGVFQRVAERMRRAPPTRPTSDMVERGPLTHEDDNRMHASAVEAPAPRVVDRSNVEHGADGPRGPGRANIEHGGEDEAIEGRRSRDAL